MWRACALAEDDDGVVREWGNELVEHAGVDPLTGEPEWAHVRYADAIYSSRGAAERSARRRNVPDSLGA